MDLGENPCLLMTNEAVGMFLKTEADDIAGTPPEPACKGATLEKDWNGQVLLYTHQGHLQDLEQCCLSRVGNAVQPPLLSGL